MRFLKTFFIIVILILFCQNIFAQLGFKNTGRNGLIGEARPNSIVVSAGGNYYFGDIERTGMFSKNFANYVNWYGQIGYRRTFFTEHLKIKTVALVGALRGEKEGYDLKTKIFEPDLIFEYYPFRKKAKKCNCPDEIIGIYLYGGVGVAFSKIVLDVQKYNQVFHKTTIAPMCALGIGYRKYISANWQLGFELGYRFVIGVDTIKFSLDGFPIIPENTKWSKWRDGFYTFGITVAYNF